MEDTLLAVIRRNGLDLLAFQDPVAFRYVYEAEYRQHWGDDHRNTDLVVTVRESSAIHARHIVTDHGWKILLDRGLDIFQRFDYNDAFSVAARLQTHRACKPFEVTYLRIEG